MKYIATIFSPPDYIHSLAFKEIAETVCFGLRELGHECKYGLDTGAFQSEGRHIIFGANMLPNYPAVKVPDDAIIYNLEQVTRDSIWTSYLTSDLLKNHVVWDYSLRNIAAFQKGVHVPIGYVPQLTRIEPDEENIDVLFYGCINERRAKILNELRARGVRVEAVYGIFGQHRDALIARSKIVLNMHYYEAQIFEAVRVSYLLANRKAVVSEDGDPDGQKGFENGVLFIPYEKLVDACLSLLESRAVRRTYEVTGFHCMEKRPEAKFLKAVL